MLQLCTFFILFFTIIEENSSHFCEVVVCHQSLNYQNIKYVPLDFKDLQTYPSSIVDCPKLTFPVTMIALPLNIFL